MSKMYYVQFSGLSPLYLDREILHDWLIINLNKIFDVYQDITIMYDGYFCGIFYNDQDKCHYLKSYCVDDVFVKLR